MNNATKLVCWIKWKDPFKRLLYKNQKPQVEVEEEEEGNEFNQLTEYHGPVMFTSDGIITLNENNTSAFNFWRGDTNWQLTDQDKFIIDHTLGIETVEVFTPYRFKVSIGKLFNETGTLKLLTNRLLQKEQVLNREKVGQKAKTTNALLAAQYKFYAVLVYEGKKMVVGGNSPEEVQEKLKKFEEKSISALDKSWEIK